MPYELHFNTNGDLTFMQIDMSCLIDAIMSSFREIYGDDIADIGITGSVIYQSSFTIDPALTFAVPSYIQ